MSGIINQAVTSDAEATALVGSTLTGRRRMVFGENSPIYITPSGTTYVLTKAQGDALYEPLLNLAANEFRARSSSGAAANYDISDFGLDLVAANDAAAIAALLDFPDLSGYTISDDGTLAGASHTALTTEFAVKTYADSLVANLLDLRSAYDASSNLFPSAGGSGTAGAILKGDTYPISVGGTIGGQVVAPGDMIIALVDTPGQTSSNWNKLETNIGYVPLNAASNLSDLVGPLSTVRTNIGLGAGDSPTWSGLSTTGIASIDASSASAALRITQTGAGYALLIEDSSSPDSTPLCVLSDGRQIVGHTDAIVVGAGSGSQLYQQYSTSGSAGINLGRFNNSANSATIRVLKSRSSTVAGLGIVQNGDTGLLIQSCFDDGVDYLTVGAYYTNKIDGTPATDVTPAKHEWGTMNAAGVSASRMELSAEGALSISSTATSTSATTGSIITLGGMGVGGNIWVAGKAALKTSDALVTVHGAMGATETFDASASDVHSGILDAACTFTLSNPSASGRQTTLVLHILQNGTGGFAITWPAAVKADPASPTVITTANTLTIFTLVTIDGGTTWIRSVVATGIA